MKRNRNFFIGYFKCKNLEFDSSYLGRCRECIVINQHDKIIFVDSSLF
jgi:hypothetical protein